MPRFAQSDTRIKDLPVFSNPNFAVEAAAGIGTGEPRHLAPLNLMLIAERGCLGDNLARGRA
jgi:hypothetical protein